MSPRRGNRDAADLLFGICMNDAQPIHFSIGCILPAVRETMNALLAPRPQRARPPIGFILVAILFYVVDGAIVHSRAFLENPEFLAAAASIDLTLGVTFVYWLLVVRPGRAALRTILPVFLLSVVAAAVTLPPGYRDFVRYLRYSAIPIELAVVGLVVVGVRRAQRRMNAVGGELDVPERIGAVLNDSRQWWDGAARDS